MAGHEGPGVVGPEDQLGVNPVLLHLFDPGHRVVAPGVDVLVAAPRTHVGRVAPGRRPPAEGEGDVVAGEHPPVPLGQAVDPGHPILVLRGHPRGPDITWFVEVAIRGDQLVLGLWRAQCGFPLTRSAAWEPPIPMCYL